MNIVISGWPGCGSTTLSLLLSYSLKIKLVRGSSTFRLLGEKMSFSDTGEGRISADEILEPYYGPIYDDYNANILETSDNILVETDYHIADKKKNPQIVSYFLHATMKSRKERFLTDKREEDFLNAEKRDESLRNKYKELFNIDWFDLDQITKQYDILIDNSEATIKEELDLVYTDLWKRGRIDSDRYKNLISESETMENDFWKYGKKHFLDKLEKENLLILAPEILRDINAKFSSRIQKLPVEIKKTILKFK